MRTREPGWFTGGAKNLRRVAFQCLRQNHFYADAEADGSLLGAWSEQAGFHPEEPVVVESSSGRLSSDAGLPLVREFDESMGLTA
jgi:hypothetical protein